MISESEEGVRFASTTTLVVCCSPTNDPCYSCLQDDIGYLLFLNLNLFQSFKIELEVSNTNENGSFYISQLIRKNPPNGILGSRAVLQIPEIKNDIC